MLQISLALLSNSLVQVSLSNSDNSSVTLIKAQSPFQRAHEDYFEIKPKAIFIGKRIKWDLHRAETIVIEGNSHIRETVNITSLYDGLKYPLELQTKFPVHTKSKDGDIQTDFKIRSNFLKVGLGFTERQFVV